MSFNNYTIDNMVLMKQVERATASITDPTTRIAETISTYVELGGKLTVPKSINTITDIPVLAREPKKQPKKEPKPKKSKSSPDTQNHLLDSFQDFKPLNIKELNKLDLLQPLVMKRQTAINETDDITENDTESENLSVNSVNVEQDQIEEETDEEIELDDNLEVIGELEQLNDGEYRYQVLVNGQTVKFGDRNLPDIEGLKKKFSPRKIQIMISKIKRNYNITDTDDINSREYWNSRVFLSYDIRAEYLKLKDIYN